MNGLQKLSAHITKRGFEQLPKVVAFDLGTKLGYCHNILVDGDDLVAGMYNIGRPDEDDKWDAYRGFVESLVDSTPSIEYVRPLLAAYENVTFAQIGYKAAHAYGGAKAILQLTCRDARVDLLPVSVGAIKKFATGNGRVKKQPFMVDAAKQFLCDVTGRDINTALDDNAADAVCLWAYTINHLMELDNERC